MIKRRREYKLFYFYKIKKMKGCVLFDTASIVLSINTKHNYIIM